LIGYKFEHLIHLLGLFGLEEKNKIDKNRKIIKKEKID